MCVLGIFSLYIIQLTLNSYFVDYIAALIFLHDFTNQFFLNSNFENRFSLLSFRKFFLFHFFLLVDFFFSFCLADFTILQFITPKHTFQVHPTVLQHRNLTHACTFYYILMIHCNSMKMKSFVFISKGLLVLLHKYNISHNNRTEGVKTSRN